jgi:hypothetical protein
MMDGWTLHGSRRQSVVFISKLQADHYGGYAHAARCLEADVILPPNMIEDFHAELSEHHEVGHC